MKIPVFDLHCDTAYRLLEKGLYSKYSLQSNPFHIDLCRASAFPAYVQCFACFTSDQDLLSRKLTPEIAFQLQKKILFDQIKSNNYLISFAHSADDIRANREAGKMSAILSIEGPAGFAYDPGKLEQLRADGFCITTLGWNDANCLVGSHCCGGGLTKQGREYVLRAQKLGMIIDVSHISDAGFWDVMDITGTSIVATHSNSRNVFAHSRNVTDDMFNAICRTGGVVGINLFTQFLGDNATLDTVCDHILHLLDLDPEGKHIALGGDLDGCKSLPEGFDGIESYPLLAECLLTRGLSYEMIMDIFWNNAMEVFARCCT